MDKTTAGTILNDVRNFYKLDFKSFNKIFDLDKHQLSDKKLVKKAMLRNDSVSGMRQPLRKRKTMP
jgi:hypothetical protein